MRCIVGLGNPEPQFDGTRHNAGFMVLNALVERVGVQPFALLKQCKAEITQKKTPTESYLFVKPATYMNESGQAIRAVLDYFKVVDRGEGLFVVHDDLDLPIGSYKMQFATGPHLHNGLLSTYEHLGTKEFWHVRVGVDGRAGERVIAPPTYVTQHFLDAERAVFETMKRQLVEELLVRLHL